MAVGLLLVMGCCYMTLYAAFHWNSFLWSLFFCILHFGFHVALDSTFAPHNNKSALAGITGGFGFVCTFLGVFLFILPEVGLTLFRILFNVGVISSFCSLMVLFVEKLFDEKVHALPSVAADALAQHKTLMEVFILLLVSIITGLTAVFSLKPRQQPRTYIREREILKEVTKEEQTQFVKKASLFTTLASAVVWKSGLIFWLCHSWYADALNFAGLFIVGAGCSFFGIWLRNIPEFGLTPYVVGNLFILFSTWCLKYPGAQMDCMWDDTRGDSAFLMITCFVLTQFVIFWWDSFVIASLVWVLFIASTAWYSLSFVTLGRFAVKKAKSMYFSDSDTPETQAPARNPYCKNK